MFWTLLIALAIIIIVKEIIHRKTTYYQITKIPYLLVRRDLGRYGEYLTYKHLRHHEKDGAKFLFNIYIPKGNDGTTEIDVLMISPKGLFVFESKNYSGWIFGSENQRNWYQTLPQGRRRSHKEAFYNPVMQNNTHIKHLKTLLGSDIPTHSIITFSDRCTLKKVQITSSDIHVINRSRVGSVVGAICDRMNAGLLDEKQITDLYEKLFPYSQVNASVKAQHIADINNLSKNAAPQPEIKQEPETQEPVPEQSSVMHSEQNPMSCPKCGGALILRTAKRGENAGNQFYGCSNFPKCKYIQILNKELNT